MAFRSRETMKKILKNVGEDKMAPRLRDALKRSVPDSKVVMGRAKRGLFAGRHIQFGNNVSEDGGNKTKRSWKPNVQDKRLFSYILDRHIRVKVTTHALRCIDKAGGIDEYLLKTPYQKMDTEMGVLWKAKIEKLYEELGGKGVVFFSPEDEAKLEQGFRDLRLSEKTARREFRKQLYDGPCQANQIEAEATDIVTVSTEVAGTETGSSGHEDHREPLLAHA